MGLCVVYFLYSKQCDKIKIGITENLPRRIKSFFRMSPDHSMKVIGYIESSRSICARIEGRLHATYQEHRINGEWFYAHPAIMDYAFRYSENHSPREEDMSPSYLPKVHRITPIIQNHPTKKRMSNEEFWRGCILA